MCVTSFFTFLFAAIATETVGAQGIFHGDNNGNHVRALVEEVTVSADLSLSLPFGGVLNPEPKTPEPTGKSGKGSSVKSMGKSGKGGLMMNMGKSGKGGSMMSMGKSGKAVGCDELNNCQKGLLTFDDDNCWEIVGGDGFLTDNKCFF
jgi:hypothetical protein